ncbi:MAG: hypothetical protein IPK19_06100 [Chloroflexi bacterium]|nr:hypothetical protein [Chloroflexota bacterium]
MKQLARATRTLAVTILLVALAAAMPVLAHGVRVTHTIDPTTGEVTLTGAFDTGEPFADAQVIIFAPSDLVTPWATGVANADGVYTFLPDYTIEGYWEIQMRLAGHGGLINLEIRADMAPAAPPEATEGAGTSAAQAGMLDGATQVVINGNAEFVVSGDVVITASGSVVESGAGSELAAPPLGGGFTPAQVAIMSAAVIWGFVGTALYFAGRRKK